MRTTTTADDDDDTENIDFYYHLAKCHGGTVGRSDGQT